jgi:hypothetical protein
MQARSYEPGGPADRSVGDDEQLSVASTATIVAILGTSAVHPDRPFDTLALSTR